MGGCVSSEGSQGSVAYIFDLQGEPTTYETEIWMKASELLGKASGHLRALTEYKGCDAVIRAVRIELTTAIPKALSRCLR